MLHHLRIIFYFIFLYFSNATPFTHGSDPGSFTNTSVVVTGSGGAEFSPFTDTGRTIYSTDPYREPTELYGNPGPPAPDFGGHVSCQINQNLSERNTLDNPKVI